MQHNGRPDDAVVTFVEVAVVRRIEVREDEHRLIISILSIPKLLDAVCNYARAADVLNGKNHNVE